MALADLARFNNYSPATFGWKYETIPPLVPLEFDGVNFGQCAKDAHAIFTAFLTDLVPHIPGGLIAGKCWGFASTDDLDDGSWSFHHYGLAIDVNWSVNPMGTYSTNPCAGQKGAIPHDAASDLARKYGMEWGGNWSGGDGVTGFKDYMHFEIHLSPADCRTFIPDTEFTMDDAAQTAFDKLNKAVANANTRLVAALNGTDDDPGAGLRDLSQKVDALKAQLDTIAAAVTK